MIFHRPIFAPNVIIVDLSVDVLTDNLPKIMEHLNIKDKAIGVNASFDDSSLNYKNIIIHQEDYEIYRHTLADNNVISKQLLNLKFKIVYYLEANCDSYRAAFVHLFDLIGNEYPIICVSNSLTENIESALTIVEHLPNSEVRIKNPKINYISIEQFMKLKYSYENNGFVQI